MTPLTIMSLIMFLRCVPNLRRATYSGIRAFSSSDDPPKNKWNVKQLNPIERTMNILRGDFKGIFGRDRTKENEEWNNTLDKYIGGSNEKPFQTHCDVLVIGGGGIGSSIAYWLKKEARQGLNVVVVEKDPMVSSIV